MKKNYISRSILLTLFKIKQLKSIDKPSLKIYSRSTIITKNFVDLFVEVYNGRRFIRFLVTSDMLGYRFGDFSFTKKMGMGIHKDKNKKNK